MHPRMRRCKLIWEIPPNIIPTGSYGGEVMSTMGSDDNTQEKKVDGEAFVTPSRADPATAQDRRRPGDMP